ncbi:unnamed protein product [Caenorhabditis bovis]|uniref:Uncharacterized protein n=1 Tax=Caenorhabditis bovis TaxID=2654633 RepID=A0A8S1E692_9PELO|nr:unnamed protein product [Caenorhabditis bovis]
MSDSARTHDSHSEKGTFSVLPFCSVHYPSGFTLFILAVHKNLVQRDCNLNFNQCHYSTEFQAAPMRYQFRPPTHLQYLLQFQLSAPFQYPPPVLQAVMFQNPQLLQCPPSIHQPQYNIKVTDQLVTNIQAQQQIPRDLHFNVAIMMSQDKSYEVNPLAPCNCRCPTDPPPLYARKGKRQL